MMRKELVNKKVVRAIALGLSAVMLTTPITAHAETASEPNDDNEPKNSENTSTVSEVANAAQEAVEDVNDVSDDVADSVKAVNDAIDAAVDDEVKLDQAVIDAKPGNDPDLSSVDTKMDDVDDKLDTAEQSDAQVTAQKNAAEQAANDAADAKADAEEVVTNAEEAVADATTKIENAATIEDANAAYDEAEEAVTKAQEDFVDAKQAYNDAKDAYDAAVNAAKAAKDVYDTAVLNAAEDADAAKVVYDKALEEANALHEELLKAQKAVGEVSAEALDIAKWEDVNAADNGTQWKNEDELFKSIMKGYYLPEVLGIEDENATVKRIQGWDNNDYNYFEVTYTKDGKEVTEYYNYKLEDLKDLEDSMVIFEKREVEVNGDPTKTPDQYVVKVGNEERVLTLAEVEAGIADGSIIEVETNGVKYLMGAKIPSDSDVNMTDSKTTKKEGKVTTITTVDVADITDVEPEYTVDEDGNLVKVVKADVTTTIVTYEDKEHVDGQLYGSAEEAEQKGWEYVGIYANETGEGKKYMNPDVEAVETTQTEYTAAGTYIPTFTKTVTIGTSRNDNVDGEVERYDGEGFLWGALDEGVETKEEAIAIAKKRADLYFEKNYSDYYVIETSESLAVEIEDDEGFLDDEDFIVSGTVTVTCAKIETDSFNLNELKEILGDAYSNLTTGKGKNDDNLRDVVKQYLESQGAIFISAEWGNGKGGNHSYNGNNATVRYVWRNDIPSGTTQPQLTEQGAQAELSAQANADAIKNGATGAYNVNATVTSKDVTKYQYKLTYLEKTSEDSDTNEEEVLKETYEADELTGQIIQNLNYVNYLAGKEGTISLKQDDEAFRKFVDGNVTLDELNDAYADLLKKVEKAQSDVTAAQAKVADLQKAIEDMKGTDISNLLDELESAETALKDATDRLAALDGELEDAAGVLDEVIDRLTPDPVDNDDEDEDEGGAAPAPVVPVVTPAVLTDAPVAPAAVVTPVAVAGGQGVVEIEDEDTPLAGGIGDAEGGEGEVIVAGAEEEVEPAIVAIEDEETPLAAGVSADGKMSWWWLLIIALLGATGYKMYKDHQKKKEEAQEA